MTTPRRPRTGVRRDGGVRRINSSEVRYPGATLPDLEREEYERWKASGRTLRPARDTGIAIESRLARERRRRAHERKRNVALVLVAIVVLGALVAGWRYNSDRKATAALASQTTSDATGTLALRRADAPDPGIARARAIDPGNDPTPLFASYRTVQLRLPVSVAALTEVGFHQAAYTYALHLNTPLPTAPTDASKKAKSTGRDKSKQETGPAATLNGSVLRMWRSRPGKPDSAADVGADAGQTVFSPVSGTVVKVKRYSLYGKYPDYEIHIQPTNHPELDLVMIHVDNVSAKPGDKVTAGVTRLAVVRHLSQHVRHQLGDYTKNGGDHVHIQLNNARDPRYKGLKDAITVGSS